VQDASKNLTWCSSIGDAIWFGFGIQHPIRLLAQTTISYSTIALCASLADIALTTEVAAMILAELADIQNVPEDLRPSLQQWQAILSCCTGSLKATPFGRIAGYFTRLCEKPMQQVGDVRDVAKALMAISRLSKGTATSITLVGNGICGWLAAFGHWFFGLEVEIRHADGTALFRAVPESTVVQISVVYGEPTADLQVSEISYIIRDMDDILETSYRLNLGQVAWTEAIGTTFGSVGDSLLEARHSFGLLVGSAAKIFAAFSEADPEVLRLLSPSSLKESYGYEDDGNSKNPFRYSQHWLGYAYRSHGQGYINYAVEVFPEMQGMKEIMEMALRRPLHQAIANYETASINLTNICTCKACSQNNPESEYIYDTCVYRLAEAIITIVWHLSLVYLDAEIHPLRISPEIVVDNWSLSSERRNVTNIGDITPLLASLQLDITLQTVELLFAGNLLHLWNRAQRPVNGNLIMGPPMKGPARCSYGICFVMGILTGNVSAGPDQRYLLHIMPGDIMLKSGAQFQRVEDGHAPSVDYPAGNYQPPTDTMTEKDTGCKTIIVDLLVKETFHSLVMSLHFRLPSGTSTRVGPEELERRLYARIRLVQCRRDSHCQVLQPPYRSTFTADGEGKLCVNEDREAGREVVIRQLADNVLARYVSLLTCDDASANVGEIFRRKECLSCCIKAALQYGDGLTYII